MWNGRRRSVRACGSISGAGSAALVGDAVKALTGHLAASGEERTFGHDGGWITLSGCVNSLPCGTQFLHFWSSGDLVDTSSVVIH